jgi:hypothetical protein
MIFKEITLSYPYVQYKVEVSHFTARKSTAIEWVVLEAINKCEKLSNYGGISIASFFEQIFTISDADLLIRPVLFLLQDMGAITIWGIDDETELNTVPMSNLKLTKIGREMQVQGLLPGVSSEETFSIYYDVVSTILKDGENIYKKEPTGIRIVDIDNADNLTFPEEKIREWLLKIQNDKKRKRLNWLTPTTKIESITSLDSILYWKNVIEKIEITNEMKWRVVEKEDENIDERTLMASDVLCPDNLKNISYLKISNLDKEIKKIVPIDEINIIISEFLQKDDLFCVEAKYYKDIKTNRQNKKKVRIGIIYGADKFEIENSKKQIIIYVPDYDIKNYGIYINTKDSIKLGITSVSAGKISKDIAIAYIPNTSENSILDLIVTLVDKYYRQDNNILFALYEIGSKDMFSEYINRLIFKEKQIADKVKIIEFFNEKGREYYGQNIISGEKKEKLLIDEVYIIEQCKDIEGAKEVITEYAEIKQGESLLKKIIKIVIEHTGKQDSLEKIWEFWAAIISAKKEKIYINWITENELYKYLYSKKAILEFIGRFTDENILKIEEYTDVERIILNMKKISLKLEELIPELNFYETISEEKSNEIILTHLNIIDELYDEIRKWQDEEEKFTIRVMDFNEVLESGTSFTNIKKNIDGLRNALAIFFDDSFIRYNKIYIVDTCTLMNEPNLISWFEDKKALLVIPMIVLDELDNFKNSDNEEKAYTAREIIRNISNYKNDDWLNIGESSHLELLPNDLAKDRNDNKILSIAIKYTVKKPILLTDDINLGNIATANNIKNMNLEAYRERKQNEKTISKKTKKKTKKK